MIFRRKIFNVSRKPVKLRPKKYSNYLLNKKIKVILFSFKNFGKRKPGNFLT